MKQVFLTQSLKIDHPLLFFNIHLTLKFTENATALLYLKKMKLKTYLWLLKLLITLTYTMQLLIVAKLLDLLWSKDNKMICSTYNGLVTLCPQISKILTNSKKLITSLDLQILEEKIFFGAIWTEWESNFPLNSLSHR